MPDLRLLVLFGSAARAGARSETDIDLAVQCDRPADLDVLYLAIAPRLGTDRLDLIDLRDPRTSKAGRRVGCPHGQASREDRPHRCPRRGAGAGGETQIVPRSIVVDASVALKWQLDDEEAVDKTLAFRDDYLLHGRVSLVAPFLLVFELTNGMLSVTRRRLSRDQAEEGLAPRGAAGIRLVAVDPARVFSLSMLGSVVL